MSTLSQMRSNIADDIDRTDLNTQIDKAINRAITHYQSERFWFSDEINTFNTAPQQANYSSDDGVPTDIAEIDYVEITISGTKYSVDEYIYKRIKELQGVASSYGPPSGYAYYKENFYFYLIPDAVYTITLSYQKKYATLSLDADTNDFLVYAEDLIESRARKILYARTIKDQDQALIADRDEQESLDALRRKTEKLITINAFVPTQF